MESSGRAERDLEHAIVLTGDEQAHQRAASVILAWQAGGWALPFGPRRSMPVGGAWTLP
jgi:hypothetical protein